MRIKIINVLSKRRSIDKSRKDTTKNKSNLDLAQTSSNLIQTSSNLAQTSSNLVQIVSNITKITLEKKQANFVASKRYVQTFLHVAISKRKQNNNTKNLKEYQSKIVCAITIFIT